MISKVSYDPFGTKGAERLKPTSNYRPLEDPVFERRCNIS